MAESNAAKRHEMLCEMQTLVHNDSGMVITYHVNQLDGVHNSVQGIPKQPLAPLGGAEWPEFAWLEA